MSQRSHDRFQFLMKMTMTSHRFWCRNNRKELTIPRNKSSISSIIKCLRTKFSRTTMKYRRRCHRNSVIKLKHQDLWFTILLETNFKNYVQRSLNSRRIRRVSWIDWFSSFSTFNIDFSAAWKTISNDLQWNDRFAFFFSKKVQHQWSVKFSVSLLNFNVSSFSFSTLFIRICNGFYAIIM